MPGWVVGDSAPKRGIDVRQPAARARGEALKSLERLLASGRVVRGAFPGTRPSGLPPVL